jgi:hypothetical protein
MTVAAKNSCIPAQIAPVLWFRFAVVHAAIELGATGMACCNICNVLA